MPIHFVFQVRPHTPCINNSRTQFQAKGVRFELSIRPSSRSNNCNSQYSTTGQTIHFSACSLFVLKSLYSITLTYLIVSDLIFTFLPLATNTSSSNTRLGNSPVPFDARHRLGLEGAFNWPKYLARLVLLISTSYHCWFNLENDAIGITILLSRPQTGESKPDNQKYSNNEPTCTYFISAVTLVTT